MNQKIELSNVIVFFNHIAPSWYHVELSEEQVALINTILDHARLGPGQDVLDVACGTGVMFPFYLQRNAASITGIDVAPEMVRISAEKFAGEQTVRVICGDVEHTAFQKQFDQVVVYNALPHFQDPARLITALAALVKPGGRLTIAHSNSREEINAGHQGKVVSHVSRDLLEAGALKCLFEPFFDVDVVISDDQMYQVSGTRN